NRVVHCPASPLSSPAAASRMMPPISSLASAAQSLDRNKSPNAQSPRVSSPSRKSPHQSLHPPSTHCTLTSSTSLTPRLWAAPFNANARPAGVGKPSLVRSIAMKHFLLCRSSKPGRVKRVHAGLGRDRGPGVVHHGPVEEVGGQGAAIGAAPEG